MLDAVDSLTMDPISMSVRYKVNDILHMLWIGTWTYHLSVTRTLLVKLLEISYYFLEIYVTCAGQQTIGLCVG